MMVLIFDGKTAAGGMREGINICMQTLIPSLFPFLVLSGVLTSALTGQTILPLHPINKICRMTPGCESLFAVGILGGYPVGAVTVANAYRSGFLTKSEANRYTIICNNAGPSFLFGVISHVFADISWTVCLWLIQITAAILTGFTLDGNNGKRIVIEPDHLTLSDAVNKALRNMAGICAWVVLFRMFLAFADRWMFDKFPRTMQVFLSGLLELSNGCLRLEWIADPVCRFHSATALLSIGGFSILMQTKAVFPQLNIRYYICGKLIHLLYSLLLSSTAILLMNGERTTITAILADLTIVWAIRHYTTRKTKKEVAIP